MSFPQKKIKEEEESFSYFGVVKLIKFKRFKSFQNSFTMLKRTEFFFLAVAPLIYDKVLLINRIS